MTALLAAGLVAGCATSDAPERAAADGPAAPPSRTATPPSPGDADGVGAVQLYAGDDERALPILPLAGGSLTLAFDVFGTAAGPLSVWLEPTDRDGRPSLFGARAIDGFERLDVVEYRPSRGARPAYTHYRAALPGPGTRFRQSGRYRLRVTALGQDGPALFERTFYVAEDGADAALDVRDVFAGGPSLGLQPTVRVATDGLNPDPFYYSACFVQDGHLDRARCTERPLLAQPSAVTFQLPPEAAFRRETATQFLDLTLLRISTDVERVDPVGDVPSVRLAPDVPAFPDVDRPNLFAQPVIEQGGRTADPATEADYVDVTFQMTPPDGMPLGEVGVAGAFNGWNPRATPLRYDADLGRYRGAARIKQGRYEYRYESPDPRLARFLASAAGRPDSRVTALVFYRDVREQADRLIAVRTLGAP